MRRALLSAIPFTLLLAPSCAPPAEAVSAPRATAAVSERHVPFEPASVRSSSLKGVEASDIDRTASACTDFYEYANGVWRAQNPIPEGKARWSRREMGSETNRRQLREMLAELATRRDAPRGTPAQLAGDFYASCMDEAGVESAALTPLAPLLGDIDAARTHADVTRLVRRLHEVAVPVPFGVTGAYENSEPTHFLANVVAGTLGLGDRDAYLKPDARSAQLREAYRAHVAKMLKLGGTPDARTREAADSVLALEKRLAEASLDAKIAADTAATEHKTTYAQLKELAPHVDWDKYFDEAKIPQAAVNVAEPKLLQQIDAELQNTPVSSWKAYLKFHLLESAAPFLGQALADESLAFKDKVTGGSAAQQPRAERCAEAAESLLGEPVGREYAERHFSPAAKAKVQEIARALVASLKDAVSAAPWMGADTKAKALEKVAGLNLQFGYPDQWKDYAAVTIRQGQLWANVAQARRFLVDDARKAVGKPTDRNGWLLPPSSPNAYLDPQLNELVLPAGFLQPPAFDIEASDAVNYGAIGAGLMHDLTHSVDATGAELDAQGRAHPWWTEADRREFEKRASCVVDQYDAYTIEPGVHLQGKLVRNEAIGDLAGLHLAFAALEKSMQTKPVPILDGFTPEQQFFLAWGQYRGDEMRLEAQRERAKGDPHPTPQYRVIGPVSSLPEFQRAFACKAGDPMVRPPASRCAVW